MCLCVQLPFLKATATTKRHKNMKKKFFYNSIYSLFSCSLHLLHSFIALVHLLLFLFTFFLFSSLTCCHKSSWWDFVALGEVKIQEKTSSTNFFYIFSGFSAFNSNNNMWNGIGNGEIRNFWCSLNALLCSFLVLVVIFYFHTFFFFPHREDIKKRRGMEEKGP